MSKKVKVREDLGAIYQEFLDLLELSTSHKTQLSARGIPSDLIQKLGYKSLPNSRAGIALALAKKFGDDLSGVPGFWKADDQGKNARWQLAGASGLLIPVRNQFGTIVQIKIRPDKPLVGAAKYISLSSAKHPNGSKAISSVHWPLSAITPIIRITEGEIKADIATFFTEQYTVSCPGVNSWKKVAEEVLQLNPQTIYVCFDSDKDATKNIYSGQGEETETDKPNDVGIYAGKLARFLDAHHPDVQIETWGEEAGKGIDDVLVDGNFPRLMGQGEKSDFIREKLAGLVQFGWFYCMDTGAMHNYDQPDNRISQKRENWNNYFMCSENHKPFENFMLDPASLKVAQITYQPKKPELLLDKSQQKLFNAWAPNPVQPSEGDITPLLNHIAQLLPVKEEAITVERFLAWLIAREGEKLAWVVLIQGEQGIGKTWFAQLLKACLGKWNVSMPDNSEIISDYTLWAKEVSTIIIDEFDAGAAQNKRKVMDTLKPMITADEVRIREMFRNHYTMPNHFNIMAFTNHSDAAYVENGDRRYFYVEAKDSRRNNPRHMIDLWDWLREPETPAKVLHWAQNYDHSWLEENGQLPAPKTQSKTRITAENRHPVDQWVEEGVQTCEHPFNRDVVCTSFLIRFVPNWVRGASMTTIGRALIKVEGVVKDPREIPFGSGRGKKRSVHYLRDADQYVDLKPKQIASLLTGDEPMLDHETTTEYTDRVVEKISAERENNPHFDDEPI